MEVSSWIKIKTVSWLNLVNYGIHAVPKTPEEVSNLVSFTFFCIWLIYLLRKKASWEALFTFYIFPLPIFISLELGYTHWFARYFQSLGETFWQSGKTGDLRIRRSPYSNRNDTEIYVTFLSHSGRHFENPEKKVCTTALVIYTVCTPKG